MSPAVSVVIATYNYGRFLAGAVDSVLGQTYRALEVIVVDDGSTDDTPRIMRTYAGDPRVRYHRAENRGPAAARNTGIRLGQAPLVAFLDADDRWLPRKLEQQVRLFKEDAAVGLAYARRLLMDEAGRWLAYEQPRLYRGDVLAPLYRTNFICLSSAVVRRAALERSGLFDERIRTASAEDYDLWLRLARDVRFDYVDEPLVAYRTGRSPEVRRAEARLATALGVMRRFLDEGGGRRRLDPAVVRRAWGETYAHMGLLVAPRSRFAALGWYARAVALAPGHTPAWKGLAGVLLPTALREALRRAVRASSAPAETGSPRREHGGVPGAGLAEKLG
jgi:glycosyltransferase involved in cell wall biosynthesis